MMRSLICFYALLFLPLIGDEIPTKDSKGVIVDLCHPSFADGVLSTEEGGVIQAEDVRIQAKKLIYTNKKIDGESFCNLYAEEDLILEFGEYYFVGEALEYDFNTHEGIIYNAKTSLEPWFFGGDQVLLHPDGSFTLLHGYITTSENREMNWQVSANEANLKQKKFLDATGVKFKIYQVPLLWLPRLKTDLDTIFDAPVRYNFKWGGHQGARASMIYEIFSWNRFKTFLRLDYRIKRGFGGGIETYYRSEDRKEIFNTINYIANDNSLSNPHEHIRYRFQGIYHNSVFDDRVSIDLSWDKLSDRDMATDYTDRGLELDTAERTELLIRKQEEDRIERLIAHLKINQFQTVKQELPTAEVSWRPKTLGTTGIIYASLARASYLDFAYSNDVLNSHDYNSTRLEWRHDFYRPIPLKYLTLTPEAFFLGIYYGNSPQHEERWLGLIGLGAEGKTSFCKMYSNIKHVVEPYIRFDYLTAPTTSPSHHYIFDISDGWFQSNTTRLGIRSSFYFKYGPCITRPLYIDLYTYGFFNTPAIGRAFPKAYLTISTLSSPTLRHTFEGGWDFQHGELDHFNVRADWTVSERLALSAEYRHRSAYAWRKADYTNFILDAYRSQRELRHSELSDRRDTVLTSLFYQFDPNWAFQFEIRHGWHRMHEPSYTEFETDLLATLPSAWNLKLSYQHREDDDRVAVYFSIGLNKPSLRRCEERLPCLEF